MKNLITKLVLLGALTIPHNLRPEDPDFIVYNNTQKMIQILLSCRDQGTKIYELPGGEATALSSPCLFPTFQFRERQGFFDWILGEPCANNAELKIAKRPCGIPIYSVNEFCEEETEAEPRLVSRQCALFIKKYLLSRNEFDLPSSPGLGG